MAELDLTNIAPASISTPAAGVTAGFIDNTAKAPLWKDDGGNVKGSLYSESVTTPAAAFAADTYLVGSSIAVPNGFFSVGTTYKCLFDVTKTNAGTATPIFSVRIGTAASVADTSVCAFTFAVGTAVVDTGLVEIWCVFRTVGSGTSAVIQGLSRITHHLAATGITTTGASGTGIIITTGGGFNSTTTGVTIGTSVNGGTSAAWTITLVRSELVNF